MFPLDLKSENYYLGKEVFYHDLSISEIRVLLLLSTHIGLKVSNMSSFAKKWCVKKDRYTNNLFLNIEKKLMLCGLISKDGTGLKLKKDFLIFKDIDLFYSCKTIKQVFILSLRCWNKKHSVLIVSAVMFYNIFHSKRAFSRACDSLGFCYEYEDKHNKIFIREKNKALNVANDLINEHEDRKEIRAKIETVYSRKIEEPSCVPPLDYFD